MKLETKYKRCFNHLLDSTNSIQLQDALTWYNSANDIAKIVSNNLIVPIENGAAIIAALSPRMHWARNVKLAIDFSIGKPIGVMAMLQRMAENARLHGIESLNGLKTRNFAMAISGDEDAIVVDTWILKAIKHPRNKVTPKQYNLIADAIRDCADCRDMSARDCQALIWIAIRGRAQ